VGQIVGGGAGGAILTIIAGLVKNMTASQQTR
jgi:fucose permease